VNHQFFKTIDWEMVMPNLVIQFNIWQFFFSLNKSKLDLLSNHDSKMKEISQTFLLNLLTSLWVWHQMTALSIK
jgi:hypothetical protein